MFSDIVAIIAMFGTFFVVYLNYKKDMAMFKLDIRMERLNKLYVPFYRIYCTKMLLTRKLTDLSIEEIKEIFDILNNNLHYLETITQDCYCNVYRVYATWIDSSSSSVESENQLNYSFGLLSNLILLDYRKLLRKCRLPEPLPANQSQASSKIKCEAIKFKINSMIAKAIMIHHSFLTAGVDFHTSFLIFNNTLCCFYGDYMSLK